MKKMNNLQDEEEDNEMNKLLFSIMEGYTDKFIPPLSQFSPLEPQDEELPSTTVAAAAAAATVGAAIGRRRSKEKTESLKKERDRRSKMAESYDLLLSMLPNSNSKATRENVVSETIAYIQSLEQEKSKLENQLKNESKPEKGNLLNMNHHRFSDTNTTSSIDVTVSSNNVAFFGIQSMVRPRLLTDIFTVFEDHKVDVLAANVVVNQRQLSLTVTAAVVNGNSQGSIEKIKRDLLIFIGI